MELASPSSTQPNESSNETDLSEGSTFRISARPVIASRDTRVDSDAPDLPRTYGTQTLCLMARDPHSIFAYWDIDWDAAFRETMPLQRKVHLRIRNEDGSKQSLVEVEPMAGSCYVTVPNADSGYSGEIGYFHPANEWNCLASSELITTPPDSLAPDGEADFATVPFHLAFQHMIDLLRISKQENESLTAMLADLRERATAPDAAGTLSVEQRDLAQVLQGAEITSRKDEPPTFWTQQKLERILGFGNSSPSEGFGGSSPTR